MRDGTLGDVSATILPGDGVRQVVPQRVVGEWRESLTFYLRSMEVRRRTRLQLLDQQGSVCFERRISIVRPPEMIVASSDGDEMNCSRTLTFRLIGGAA